MYPSHTNLMNNLNKFTLAASVLFSVVACQKVNSVEPQQPKAETSQTNQASYGDYTVARGRMVFSDTTAFRKMTDYLNSNKNELAAWDEQGK